MEIMTPPRVHVGISESIGALAGVETNAVERVRLGVYLLTVRIWALGWVCETS